MHTTKRTPAIVLLILFCVTAIAYGQENTDSVSDSTIQNYIKDAWDEVRNTSGSESDSLQKLYSNELYSYYQGNPDTEVGKEALSSAVRMWGNTGNDQHVDDILANLDYDDNVWNKLIHSLGSIYYRSENRDMEAFNTLLFDLKEKLTDPKSKSEVILKLIRYKIDEDKALARKLAKELVEVDATEFYVGQGQGYLHELNSLGIGQQSPDFELETLNGEKITLSDLEGQYVLLDFWATWCGPCLPEIPHLKTLWKNYDDNNFTIVSISFDQNKDELTDFIDEKDMEWPQVHKPKSWSSEISGTFNVQGIPRTFFISPEGEIIAKDMRGEQMIAKIEQYISE